ncbi:patatin-like phospholipase family protein [Fictibacillus phosphorivorans]|uniref:patatin-like phospholipase family protein n=1 Tax=Fictibacillus phosphorivorans TaxID=1221500 RepID=UPI00203EEFD4|nr:patatin family protein [Fictibacillus phosphorivorans]MCM3718583.1 patatin family protein [Fictibacillus phosphorivorans]MCM3776206.1 patatin family protein [Fictibacillus phosphorivorans]
MENSGLILEGGGMRGVYTAGVLDVFMENDLYFPYVIGASAGACNAASYLSRQHGRNRTVNLEYSSHPEYISYKNWLIKKKGLFGMDFIFNELPNRLVPFDYEAFKKSQEKFVVVVTDCRTGEPVYFNREDFSKIDLSMVLRASSSIPFIAPVVELEGKHMMDGGIADPIPVRRAVEDGVKKGVVVLTQNPGYRKKKPRMTWVTRRFYPEYTGLDKSLRDRYAKYNATLDYIEEEEKKGNLFVLRPLEKMTVKRIERDPKKLSVLYEQGRKDALDQLDALRNWLTN